MVLKKIPSATVFPLAFLYLCWFSAGVEGSFHKDHETRALWHWFHLFGSSLSHMFVCCCWGGRVVLQGAWCKILLACCSLFWMSLTMSSCCCLTGGWAWYLVLFFLFAGPRWKLILIATKGHKKKGIANWMPQWFMKLIQNGTPKRMHFTFVKALRTYGFGTLQSKLQLQKCLLMNMRYIHLHNGGRIISKQMNCLLRKHLPPYIVSLWIWRYFDRLRKHLRHHSVIHVFQQVSDAFFGLGFCTSCHSCLILLMPLMSLGRCGMVPLQNMFLS